MELPSWDHSCVYAFMCSMHNKIICICNLASHMYAQYKHNHILFFVPPSKSEPF